MIAKAKTIRRLVCNRCFCVIGTGGLCSFKCPEDNVHEDERPVGSVVVAVYALREERPYTPSRRAAQRLAEREVRE